MKPISVFLILMWSISIFSQESKISDNEFQLKLDSIKNEGNLLYSLENASWNASDIIRENKMLRNEVGQYLTYKSNDTVKTVFLNKKADKVMVEYLFLNNSKKAIKHRLKERDLNSLELNLKNNREKLISQLSDPKYEVGVPEGFNLNLITIPSGNQFRTYIITGANDSGVIPFGNDYLFVTDKIGNILESKKFHSRLIPQYTSTAQGEMSMSTHSHLKTNSFISATDICTFKLYAPFTKLEKFFVYSPAYSTYFEYDGKKDTLKKVKSPF